MSWTQGPTAGSGIPPYTGFLLALAGVMLTYANWLALIGVLPALAGFLYRIRVEERVLSDELGDPYRAYMRRTKRLVPYVYRRRWTAPRAAAGASSLAL